MTKVQTMTDDITTPQNTEEPVDGVFSQATGAEYSEADIQTLDWKEHIQRRPGMYIGKLGDGTNSDDGIYVLLKEVLDNSIDEYMMGYGNRVRSRWMSMLCRPRYATMAAVFRWVRSSMWPQK